MLIECKTPVGNFIHTITENSLKIIRNEDGHTFYSVNRITGEVVITYPASKILASFSAGSFGVIFKMNKTMENYCIPIRFSQSKGRVYARYLGRFRSLFRPEIRFTVGKDALRRINRVINMKVTGAAMSGKKKAEDGTLRVSNVDFKSDRRAVIPKFTVN